MMGQSVNQSESASESEPQFESESQEPTPSQTDSGRAASWRMRSSPSAGSATRLQPPLPAPAVSFLLMAAPLPVLPQSAPPAVGAPRAALPASRRLRAAALKDLGQWWWVAGLQAPPRATKSALQQPQQAGMSSSDRPAAALAALQASQARPGWHASPGAQRWVVPLKGIKNLQHLAAALKKGGWRSVAPHGGAVASREKHLHHLQWRVWRA